MYLSADVEIDRLDLVNQLQTEDSLLSGILPTCNRNATNVKDVYNIYDIIPKSKLETLYEHATEVLNGDLEGYLIFFMNVNIFIFHLCKYYYICLFWSLRKGQFFKRTLKTIQSDPDNMNKVALLLYIEMINAWFAMPMKNAKKRDVVICSVSEEVNQHIIDTYSISSANGR